MFWKTASNWSYNIRIWEPQIRVLIRFQPSVTFLAFAIHPIHHHEIYHHRSSLVQSEISAVLPPSFLLFKLCAQCQGNQRLSSEQSCLIFSKNILGTYCNWYKRNCAILTDLYISCLKKIDFTFIFLSFWRNSRRPMTRPSSFSLIVLLIAS